MIRPNTKGRPFGFEGLFAVSNGGPPFKGGDFIATRFYADVQGHPGDRNLAPALEDLSFFSHEVKIPGVDPAHPYRLHSDAKEE